MHAGCLRNNCDHTATKMLKYLFKMENLDHYGKYFDKISHDLYQTVQCWLRVTYPRGLEPCVLKKTCAHHHFGDQKGYHDLSGIYGVEVG